ncbi:MAG: oligosaccharide flippase family protein [Actinomycetia bacterium]|nr:oligosaccharide flippase family protein [Actinomycetes bacterium]
MTPRLSSSETLQNVGRLASGTAIAQAAPLLATPILTRLYTPVQFGEYGVFVALLMGLSVVVSGRYEVAVPLPKSDDKAYSLLALSLIVSVMLSAVLAVTGVVASVIVDPKALASLGVTSRTVIMLPVGILFAAVMQSAGYWFTRQGAFRIVALARSLMGIITALAAIALGAVGISSGLIVSVLMGYVVTGSVLLVALIRRTRGMTAGISGASLKAVAREYREFPLLNSPHALLDTARESLTLMLTGALFGPTVLGFLSQTLRVLRAPMSLIGQAVSQVFFPRASRAHAEGTSLAPLTRRTMRGVLAVSVPIYLAVLVAGPWLFSVVFGPTWRQSGVYAQILSPWLALVLVVSSLSTLPIIKRQQPRALAINVVETATRLIALLVGARFAGVRGAIAGIAIAGLLVGMGQLAWYRHLAAMAPRVAGIGSEE